MLRTTVVVIALCACHGGRSDSRPPTQVQQEQGIDKDRAVAIAIDAGRAQGYDPALYNLASVEFATEAGSFRDMWRVYFELKPPGRPGGHFTVYVARDGTPQLFHGK